MYALCIGIGIITDMAISVVSVIGKMHSEISDLHTLLPGTVLSLYLLLFQNCFIMIAKYA